MKKKVLFYMIATAVVVLAGWNVSQSRNEAALADMALANVEALADCEAEWNGEVIFSCSGTGTCEKTVKKWGQTVRLTCSGTEVSG
jgi:hypothetical protein